MNVKSMLRDYLILNSMGVSVDNVLADILSYTFADPHKNEDIPDKEYFEKCVASGRVKSIYFGVYLDKISTEFDIEPHIYVLQKHAEGYDKITFCVHWVHVFDEKYILVPIQVKYLSTMEPLYTGYIGYTVDYTHTNFYLNGNFINKRHVDEGEEYMPYFMRLLHNRIYGHPDPYDSFITDQFKSGIV